jgi:hypothetical protein
VLEDAYPELRGQPDFSNLIWADLYNAGLVQTPTMRPRLDAEGQVLKGTSELGDAFLEFIEDSL